MGRKPISKKIVVFVLATLILVSARLADAQQTIFLVRHAEQAAEVEDPPLIEAGQRRAVILASILKDTGISAIYTNEFMRSIQTAEPLAKVLNIKINVMPRRDIDGLVSQLRHNHARSRVLVVTSSATLPAILKALGHSAEFTIARFEYDNLFVIVPKSNGSPLVLRLRY